MDFIYLKPADPPCHPRPLELLMLHSPTDADVDAAVSTLGTAVVDLDFETTGLDATDPAQRIVGVGLANEHGRIYLDVRHWAEGGPEWAAFLGWLDHVGFWAFNQGFDYAWAYRYAGHRHLKMLGCTSVLFRILANEGHPGQRHSLDVAMAQVLGWPSNQKSTLADLLVKHQLVTGSGAPDKGRMWELAELEPVAFGSYCALDAEASWQLRQVLEPQARRSEAWRLVTQEWVTAIRLKVEAQHAGVLVDVPALATYHAGLLEQIAATKVALRTHPRLCPHIDEAEAGWWAEATRPVLTTSRVKMSKAEAVEARLVGAAEADLAAAAQNGWVFQASTAKTLAKWQAELGGFWFREVVTERPRNRKCKVFNFESDPDMRWLLYSKVYPDPKVDLERRIATVTVEGGRTVEVNLTDGGSVPVGKDILPALGAIGALFSEFNRLTKLEGYVRSYLAAAARDGRIHIDLRAHGTATGRWAGGSGGSGSMNWQQLPKVLPMLACFQADPGHTLVQTDMASLEPRVMATFSQDPTMLELFASGKPHDVYLYVAAALFPEQRAAIDAVYNLTAPTKDSVDAAKRTFKAERKVGKLLHLAASYLAGPPKIYRNLVLQGVDTTLADVKAKHARYWVLFAGVRRWNRALEREREDRGGWVWNGIGRPMAVPEMRCKDLVNLVVQSTGHDILLTYLWHVDRLRCERQVRMRPWSSNEHDATVWQAPDADAAAAAAVLRDAYTALNAELDASVPITGDVEQGRLYADFKG
jgi:hypothetical protein